MPMTNYASDTFISQDISKLSSCSARPLMGKFTDATTWLELFVLNSIFRAPCSTQGRQLAFAIIRRSRTSLLAHDEGLLALERYLSSLKNGSRNIGEYFEALSRFEYAIATLYQGLDVYAKVTKQRLFEKLDGSPKSRLNLLYNISKHYLPDQLPDGHLQAVWIANDGLHCSEAALTWEEFANLLQNLAEIAQYIIEGRYASQLSETTDTPETVSEPRRKSETDLFI